MKTATPKTTRKPKRQAGSLTRRVRRWRNAWKHKPPVNREVLIWWPTGSGGTYAVDVLRRTDQVTGEIMVRYGNTAIWMELPPPPNAEVSGAQKANDYGKH